MARFIQLLIDISNQVERKFYQKYNANFDDKLITAIQAWLDQAIPPHEKSIVVGYINQGFRFYRVKEVAKQIHEDWNPEKGQNLFSSNSEKSRLNLVEPIFKQLGIARISMNIIVFIAFVITAVAYLMYILDKQKQQESTTDQSDYRPTSSPEPSYRASQPTSTVSSPPVAVQQITKKLLILVISAAQESIIDSINAKPTIDYDDCKKLYDATQYLCQDNESNLLHKLAEINQFKAIKKSEFDIYIVTIKLNQADEGFNKNVNQVVRYDAFRNLSNLAVEVSPRLQMEAYGTFDVYKR